MELRTKYQYTYFIYPYLIEANNYTKYLYKMLKNKQCKLKLFTRKKDVGIDSYFLPDIKDKMFWSLDFNQTSIKSYETMDLKLKSRMLSKQFCNVFEYVLEEDIPGKVGEEEGIFFDINKVEIVCFNSGVCFLLIKTALSSNSSFEDVLNFNYKFRDIQSKITHTKQYDSIKIQTKKLSNMQKFPEFLVQIAGTNIDAKKINLDTNRLITYSYVCLNQESWNDNTDINVIEKAFEKYYTLKPSSEQINDAIYQKTSTYKENYLYYGFSSNSTMLLTAENNIQNYTELLFKYENEQFYHFIYHLHQKIFLNKLNYELNQSKRFESIKARFIEFAKKNWIYEVTNNQEGSILDKYYKQEQNLEETFIKLKSKYNLLYKEYEIGKTIKYNNWLMIIIGLIAIIGLIKLWINFF